MCATEPALAVQVLDFWYGPLQERLRPNYEHRYELWFGRGADHEITERFSDAIGEVGSSEELRREWCKTPRGALAYIVLLDQLNRNLHRGSGRMFEHDTKCLEEARRLVAERRHLDGSLAPPELAHLSICLSHSESLADHELNLGTLLPELMRILPAGQARHFEGHAHMSGVHADEIRRFGRYPHRNALLQREDTVEERAWLQQSRYGYHRQVKK